MGPQNWFVVVNRSSAKIFEVSRKPDALTWLKTIRNPLGTARNKLMRLDKPGWGRGKLAQSKNIHSVSGEKDPHEEVAVEFAKKIAHYLKDHKEEKEFSGLTIAAEPHMMGLVKKAIERDKFKAPINWLRKDLEKMSTEKLETMLFNAKKTKTPRTQ